MRIIKIESCKKCVYHRSMTKLSQTHHFCSYGEDHRLIFIGAFYNIKGVPSWCELPKPELNVNDCVWVKLTDVGRKKLREFSQIKEDEEGWSKWQFWVLMSVFGDIMCSGCDIPFETTIKLEFKNGGIK